MPTYKNVTLVDANVESENYSGTLKVELVDRKVDYVVEVKILCDPEMSFIEFDINSETIDYQRLANLIQDQEELSYIRESIFSFANEWLEDHPDLFDEERRSLTSILALEVLPIPDGNHPRRKPTL